MNELLVVITNISRIIFFPVNFALRLLLRIVLLGLLGFAIVLPFVLTVLVILNFTPVILEQWSKHQILLISAFLAASIGFTCLITYSTKSIRNSLSTILGHMGEVLQSKWMPELEIGKGLTTTWELISDATPMIQEALKSSRKLFFSMVILHIALFMVWMHVIANEDQQQRVKKELKEIQEQHHKSATNFAKWQIEVKRMHKDPRPPDKKSSVFFLFYPPEGDLKTKKGICPDKESLKNLSKFKSAIAECSENGPRLEIEVRAFASIAPVKVDGNDDCSDLLNCEIANQRAEAVVGMLIEEQEDLNFENCKTILRDNKYGRQPGKLCTRETNDCNSLRLKSKHFDVIYSPWHSYKKMIDARPADDGTLSSRRQKAEFLNRVVQIVVNNDVCWREEWLDMNH